MNLLRFRIEKSVFSIRTDGIIKIVGRVDLLERQRLLQNSTSESENMNIKVLNIRKLLNLHNKNKRNPRIIFINSISIPYGILVDEILHIGDGFVREFKTPVPIIKGIDPNVIEGFEVFMNEVSIVLDCDSLIRSFGRMTL
ncbi:MAG: chemotaxis protein CheW [Spirochaetota bacterium]|nr:chemotaxis protein CheW [Spirochaetota bacterium]